MEPTRILVADSAPARLCRLDRPRGPLAGHSDFTNPADRLRERHLETDAPGRGSHYPMSDSGTKADYADRFARQIAEVRHRGRTAGEFARLYVMAAPNCLGALRHVMDGPPAACVVASYARHVVREPADGIRKHLPCRL